MSERYEKDRTTTGRECTASARCNLQREPCVGPGICLSPRFWRRRDVGRYVAVEEVFCFALFFHFLAIIELRSYCGGGDRGSPDCS